MFFSVLVYDVPGDMQYVALEKVNLEDPAEETVALRSGACQILCTVLE
jgi:hypothetical protein